MSILTSDAMALNKDVALHPNQTLRFFSQEVCFLPSLKQLALMICKIYFSLHDQSILDFHILYVLPFLVLYSFTFILFIGYSLNPRNSLTPCEKCTLHVHAIFSAARVKTWDSILYETYHVKCYSLVYIFKISGEKPMESKKTCLSLNARSGENDQNWHAKICQTNGKEVHMYGVLYI